MLLKIDVVGEIKIFQNVSCGRIYGTYSNDENVVKMTGWPAEMEFSQTACENFTNGGVVLYYMDLEKYVDVLFGVKKAPAIADMKLTIGEKAAVQVENLAEDAVVTYEIADKKIAHVSKDGEVIAGKAGETELTVTVNQYNRTDTFTASVTVDRKDLSAADVRLDAYIKDPWNSKNVTLLVNLICDRSILLKGRDYDVSISKDGSEVKKITEEGVYEITAVGKSSYEGTFSKTVEIVKESKIIGTKTFEFWKIR